MPRRRTRGDTMPETFFAILICIILPLGVLGVLVVATVQNFLPTAEKGWCQVSEQTVQRASCLKIYHRGIARYLYDATIPDLYFEEDLEKLNTSATHGRCTVSETFESEAACRDEITAWAPGDPPVQCYRVIEHSWWLSNPTDKPSSSCMYYAPDPPDLFDTLLPIACATVLLVGVGLYWGARAWSRLRRRRAAAAAAANGGAGENDPLLRQSDTAVVRHGTVDLITVSAVWTSSEDAAVVVGDASKGEYPCQVHKIYDVGTTVQQECIVCLENKKQVVMWPCRHLCVCADCAVRLRKCPVCRAKVKRRLCLELTSLAAAPGDGSTSAHLSRTDFDFNDVGDDSDDSTTDSSSDDEGARGGGDDRRVAATAAARRSHRGSAAEEAAADELSGSVSMPTIRRIGGQEGGNNGGGRVERQSGDDVV
eukprot:Rhum_TRINITY_DN14930_c3_g1::Rhum_TRINITY_DN14930_c3_g1_i1::g.128859::m.128859